MFNGMGAREVLPPLPRLRVRRLQQLEGCSGQAAEPYSSFRAQRGGGPIPCGSPRNAAPSLPPVLVLYVIDDFVSSGLRPLGRAVIIMFDGMAAREALPPLLLPRLRQPQN